LNASCTFKSARRHRASIGAGRQNAAFRRRSNACGDLPVSPSACLPPCPYKKLRNTGRFTTRDMMRIGIPLAVVMYALIVICMVIYWPRLRPRRSSGESRSRRMAALAPEGADEFSSAQVGLKPSHMARALDSCGEATSRIAQCGYFRIQRKDAFRIDRPHSVIPLSDLARIPRGFIKPSVSPRHTLCNSWSGVRLRFSSRG